MQVLASAGAGLENPRPSIDPGDRSVQSAAHEAPLVEIQGLGKRFGDFVAVHPLDLSIGRGEFVAILGPSGCGKTTLLRMIGGFLQPSLGTIRIAGKDVTRLGPERRPTNMVFQSYGLFPHMNVAQNVAYGLRVAKLPEMEIEARVHEAIALVALDGYARNPVTQLSGGQQQRVALARALVMRPAVLLLDEPLGALDLKLRRAMQEELRRIHHSIGGTFIFVTHDQEEAMGLASRIAVMEQGRIVQDDSPQEIYARPGSRFVSTFIGEANILRGSRADGWVSLEEGARFPDAGPDEATVTVVRPEFVCLDAGEEAIGRVGGIALGGRIDDIVFLGPHVRYAVTIASGDVLHAHSRDPVRGCRIGDRVHLSWAPQHQLTLPDR